MLELQTCKQAPILLVEASITNAKPPKSGTPDETLPQHQRPGQVAPSGCCPQAERVQCHRLTRAVSNAHVQIGGSIPLAFSRPLN